MTILRVSVGVSYLRDCAQEKGVGSDDYQCAAPSVNGELCSP